MVARLPQQWAEVDRLHAVNLARCLADIEVNRKAILREGTLIRTPSGQRLNPRHALLETLNRRAMFLTRLLQLHAVPIVGRAKDQGGAKGEAAQAEQALRDAAQHDDALLARPRLVA